MQKQPLIILTGPTAVGKTKASIGLAKAIGGEIISADSMQVYKYMDIGSAKIRPEEMQYVPHYLVDELEPDDEFHVVRFQQMAKEAMKKIYAAGHIPRFHEYHSGCNNRRKLREHRNGHIYVRRSTIASRWDLYARPQIRSAKGIS